MADPAETPSIPAGSTPRESVDSVARALLAEFGTDAGAFGVDAVIAITDRVEESDTPLPVLVAVPGGCGGGRRVMVQGRSGFRSDGVLPTHLLVWSDPGHGPAQLVVLERGDRGVVPWPAAGVTRGWTDLSAVRLDSTRVLGVHPG